MRKTTLSLTRSLICALGLCGLLAAAAAEARADAVQLFARSQLSASATTAQYADPAYSILSSPFVMSAAGNSLTFSNSGQFERRDDGPEFQTDFAEGTRLLLSQGTTNNVTTIDFAAGVTQLGFDLQDFPVVGNFQIEVFNGDTSLGTFSVLDIAGDGLPAFFGVSTSGGDVITRVVITGFTANYAIGPVSFVNASAPAEVPEPATLLLLGTGVAGAFAAARRRRAVTGEP